MSITLPQTIPNTGRGPGSAQGNVMASLPRSRFLILMDPGKCWGSAHTYWGDGRGGTRFRFLILMDPGKCWGSVHTYCGDGRGG